MKMKNVAMFFVLIGLGASPFCPECDELMVNHTDQQTKAEARELTEAETKEVCEEACEAETTSTEGLAEEPMDDDTDELTYVGNMKLTWYCPCEQCCGTNYYSNYHVTASGNYATEGVTVSSNDLPIGTDVYIEGYGEFTVEDTGSMGNGIIDIFCESHEQALENGVDYADVYVIER